MSVAGLLRELHDLTAGSDLAQGGEVVCHGDIAPRNVVFDGQRAVCFLDWDLAAPGPRVKDLALAARRMLGIGPFGRDPSAQGRRIRSFLDAYGFEERDGFIFRIIEYQAEMVAEIAEQAAVGDERFRVMMRRWSEHPVDNASVVLEWIVNHTRQLEDALVE
jgi:Ser/Thr protein kinase RdoA (MazF antagonist)